MYIISFFYWYYQCHWKSKYNMYSFHLCTLYIILTYIKHTPNCNDVFLWLHMTGKSRWRSRRPRYKAAAHVPDFHTLVPDPKLSLPIHLCRHIFKEIIFLHPRATALEPEQECRNPVRERQLCSGDVCFVTWRSSSYTLIINLNWIVAINSI